MISSPHAHGRGAVLAGRYVIRRRLGSGSLGKVYLAFDEKAQRPVALKLIRTDRLTSETIAGLQSEFRAIAELRHPQIALAFDFGYLRGESPGRKIPYYTREYVPGNPLPPGPPTGAASAEFLQPIFDLLSALEYLHASGRTHRDIHAGNLIVADDTSKGSVLIDLGLARSLAPIIGTPDSSSWLTAPPELRAGQIESTSEPTVDCFMAGQLLHYRLTGRCEGEARLPPEISGWGARTTLALERITAKAIDPRPARRFSSATEFREALADAIGESFPPRGHSDLAGGLVGRERELTRIDDVLREFEGGRSVVLWFTAPTGLGKSRLLQETRWRAQLRGLEVVEVRFPPGPSPEPALLKALRSTRSLPKHDRSWLSALAAEHGGSTADRALRAARSYFEEQGQPLVLILDDIEHADADSRLLADALRDEILKRRANQPRAMCLCVGSALTADGLPAHSVMRVRPFAKNASRSVLLRLLGSLSVPSELLAEAVECGRGSPLRLKQIARALQDEWGRQGAVPPTAGLPTFVPDVQTTGLPRWAVVEPQPRAVLQVLAVVERPVGVDEIAAAAELEPPSVRRVLRRLVGAELLAISRHRRARRFRIESPDVVRSVCRSTTKREVRAIHERLAVFLATCGTSDPSVQADRARHLLQAGRQREGRRLAVAASRALREIGFLRPATQVLEAALAGERAMRSRLEIAEEISALLEEAGDDEDGIRLLEPLYKDWILAAGAAPRPTRRDQVRVRRMLGTHYHRAGDAVRALAIFEEAIEFADPRREIEDLIFIDSELAEIHTYRGDYDRAEEAANRGLARLERLPSGGLSMRMEVVLRASLGQLELRRMNLPRARTELRSAAALARTARSPAIEAVILNNLGVVERQLSHFPAAQRCFRAAERILLQANEGRSLIKIACNLAVVAAHRGEGRDACEHVERAERLLRRHPGRQLEFFVPYTRGIVAQMLGDAGTAAAVLDEALVLGRALGDTHLVAFGEVYLAEAHVFCGRYHEARTHLRRAAGGVGGGGAPLLVRMAASRLLLVETLTGNRRARARASRELEATARTGAVLPETWNDLFIALARLLAGENVCPSFRAVGGAFRRLKVPAGERAAACGAGLEALLASRDSTRDTGDPPDVGKREEGGAAPGRCDHSLLAVAEPLLRAATRFACGDLESARASLAAASRAMVGRPFLEFDLWIEVLRGGIALRESDVGSARRHLHRGLRTLELLQQMVPHGARRYVERHPRFRALHDLQSRLDRVRNVVQSTRRLVRSGRYEGIIGAAPEMVRVFRLIERLRDQDIPVLVSGEAGTGKDLVVRTLHRTSARSDGPFLALHCASLLDELFESELFGFEAGAFTGAETTSAGILEQLAGGTILLDDIHELSVAAQGKLVHVLDSGQARRLGARQPIALDVRFIASTTVDLDERVEQGRFRRDLLLRLRVVEIELPPLRRRREDIEDLAQHLLEQHAGRMERAVPRLTPDALEVLRGHAWTGNVRELETLLIRALIVTTGGGVIERETITPWLSGGRRESGGATGVAEGGVIEAIRQGCSLKELRRELDAAYLRGLWHETAGDLGAMMRVLGMKRTQLYELLKKSGVDLRELRAAGGDEGAEGFAGE